MSESKKTETTSKKEVVKGDSKNFVKKAASADSSKKSSKKNSSEKSKTESKKTSDNTQKKSRAEVAREKYGVDDTWRPFQAWAIDKGLVKAPEAKKSTKKEEKK